MSGRGSQRIRESPATLGSIDADGQIRVFGKVQEAKCTQLPKQGGEGGVREKVYRKLWPLCNSFLRGVTAKPLVVGLH